MIDIGRKITVVLLIIWWGAFTFYAGIVVPIGMRVLGSHTKMGFITQAVTNYLNYFSIIIFVGTAFQYRTQKKLFGLSILLIFLQITLFILHFKLNLFLDFQLFIVKSKASFYLFHRIYLLISTLIWLLLSTIILVEVKNNN
ncbi:hypothetical protein EMA8858_00247 [Emticicia aquatica]|uniref:DUF4149 domain-containing protein n=1 Tax=Emticicia aquatica TaxID=1681835 RepID=A0ABN8ENG4_9BACT|nr:hypothetical protein [Emticicia aquatica]CAH0994140.1 hypothetical protein EMA8858_00247 [Emticicia aquatica]